MENRTAPEWYSLLPEEYRLKALKNLKHAKNTRTFTSLHDAIGQGFIWAGSKQGSEYWRKVYEDLKEGKIKLKDDVNQTETTK